MCVCVCVLCAMSDLGRWRCLGTAICFDRSGWEEAQEREGSHRPPSEDALGGVSVVLARKGKLAGAPLIHRLTPTMSEGGLAGQMVPDVNGPQCLGAGSVPDGAEEGRT